jgi:branched-chain amino acid transport system ATP-binding protein
MTDALLKVRGLGKRFGGFVALTEIDLDIHEGERIGLIGPNGSGKSTLVNCLCGTLRNEKGEVSFAGHRLDGMAPHQRVRLGIARSFQLPRPFPTMTLAENILVPTLYSAGAVKGHIGPQTQQRCHDLLQLVGLDRKASTRPRELTQIEMRKLELARALASEPRLLIADEAMAGLTHREVDDILSLLMKLNSQGVTIVMIEHIMRAVLAFSQRLVVLVAGRKIADGQPTDIIRRPDVVAAYLGS